MEKRIELTEDAKKRIGQPYLIVDKIDYTGSGVVAREYVIDHWVQTPKTYILKPEEIVHISDHDDYS